jgi:predicted dehydrogenase
MRIAVIGAGHMGSFYIEKILEMARYNKELELVAVVDTDPIAAAACHLKHPDICVLEKMDEIKPPPKAVIIATPTETHFGLAIQAILDGIHILVEKPFTKTIDEAAFLSKLGDFTGTVIQVGFIERFNPLWRVAMPHIKHPCNMAFRRMSTDKTRCGGDSVVMDMMLHDIDLALSVARCPVRMYDAAGTADDDGRIVSAAAMMEFENGAEAVMIASCVARKQERRITIRREDFPAFTIKMDLIKDWVVKCGHGRTPSDPFYALTPPGR